MSMNLKPGSQAVNTTAILVGTSGKPMRVYTITMISDGTAGVLKLYEGTSTGGTLKLQLDGTINKQVSFDSAMGIRFTSGCWMETDAHCVAGVITFSQEF